MEQVIKLDLRAEDALWPTDVLSATFADLVRGKVQVVVQTPFVGAPVSTWCTDNE